MKCEKQNKKIYINCLMFIMKSNRCAYTLGGGPSFIFWYTIFSWYNIIKSNGDSKKC